MNKVKMLIAAAFAVMSLISCTEKPDAPTRTKIRKPLEEISSWNKY